MSYAQIRRLRLQYTEVPVTILYSDRSLAKGQRLSSLLNILWEFALGALRKR